MIKSPERVMSPGGKESCLQCVDSFASVEWSLRNEKMRRKRRKDRKEKKNRQNTSVDTHTYTHADTMFPPQCLSCSMSVFSHRILNDEICMQKIESQST